MPIITFIGNNELLIREARVYVDDPNVVFIFNGRFWMHARDVRDVVMLVVAMVAKGRKYIRRTGSRQ